MNEETTTEIVLYEVARRHQSGNYRALPATKAEESGHGADWLWWFGDVSNGVGFRVQAKQLFASGRYRNLFKSKGNPQSQLNKLVRMAKKDGYHPLYCFYNFRLPPYFATAQNCGHGYRAPSYWGCSIALPEDIKRQNSDHVADLHRFMLPWHFLVCTDDETNLAEAAIRAISKLARPKPLGEGRTRRTRAGRGRLSLNIETRATPSFVRELLEIRRPQVRRREIEVWDQITERARVVLEQQKLAGLAIFEDTRF